MNEVIKAGSNTMDEILDVVENKVAEMQITAEDIAGCEIVIRFVKPENRLTA